MKKYVLTYGAIAGSIVIATCIAGMLLGGDEPASGGALVGYLIMIVAFCLIFPAVKRYRDIEQGGVIRFGRALLLGLGISAVASVFYVVGWEIYLAKTDHRFAEQFAEASLRSLEEAGASEEQLSAEAARMEGFQRMYANPLFRVPITFSEILPVGLLVSLIAAGVLRRSEILPAESPPS